MDPIKEKSGTVKAGRRKLKNKYVAADTDTEKKLVKIFEEFFGIDKIGMEDDFFELGGDSLKAMALLKKIGKEFEVVVHLRNFLKLSTIKQVAIEIENNEWLKKDVKMNNEIII